MGVTVKESEGVGGVVAFHPSQGKTQGEEIR